MAVILYPFECEVCARKQDHFLDREEYERGAIPPCESCKGSLRRIFTVPNEIRTENTWKPYWSDQLATEGEGKAYIGSREEYERRMSQMGVQPFERGTSEAAERSRARDFAQARVQLADVAEGCFEEVRHLSPESLREREGEIKDEFAKEEAAA